MICSTRAFSSRPRALRSRRSRPGLSRETGAHRGAICAGGGVDIVARAVGQELGKRFGQTVLVENRTGAAAISAPNSSRKRPPTATRC